jgi:hypothetical protein
MMQLLSRPDYERWLYAIPAIYSAVRSSTLRFFTTSATTATVMGTVLFHSGHELRVSELVDFAAGEILDYGYEVWRSGEKLYWYDPQPHPGDPTLASTDPHHKHIPPDIKHHRIPAPGLSFDRPNLPLLIEEIAASLLAS